MRDSVVFYKSFYDSIKNLKDVEERELCYKAIFEYAFEDNTIDLEGTPNSIFILIKPQIDANNIKYENGKKGGAPKGSRNNPNGRKGKRTNQELTETNQELTENKRNVNVNVNDNDNVNVNEGGPPETTHKLRPGQIMYGVLQNVAMTSEQRAELSELYQDSNKLVDKVSRWLPNANKDFPDHFALCLTFADNDKWPKKSKPKPVEEKPIEAEPMPEDMRASIYNRLGKVLE